jgi:hypothetical protein
MVKCPDCGKDGKNIKQWAYGPRNRKGASFNVSIYECSSGHKWRLYEKKSPIN